MSGLPSASPSGFIIPLKSNLYYDENLIEKSRIIGARLLKSLKDAKEKYLDVIVQGIYNQ